MVGPQKRFHRISRFYILDYSLNIGARPDSTLGAARSNVLEFDVAIDGTIEPTHRKAEPTGRHKGVSK
jgi:hypothetical protein